jgi:hypothetical protein
MRIRLFSIVAAVAIAGCGADRTDDMADTGAPDTTASALPGGGPAADSLRAVALPASCDDLAGSILAADPTRAALLAQYGRPDSTHSETQPNRHAAGVIDSLFDVHYPGLRVSVHKPGGGGDLPSRAEIGDNRYLAYPRIGIGAPADSVVAALGPGADGGADVLTYDCGMGAGQPVRFHLENGRVTRITIDFYVD